MGGARISRPAIQTSPCLAPLTKGGGLSRGCQPSGDCSRSSAPDGGCHGLPPSVAAHWRFSCKPAPAAASAGCVGSPQATPLAPKPLPLRFQAARLSSCALNGGRHEHVSIHGALLNSSSSFVFASLTSLSRSGRSGKACLYSGSRARRIISMPSLSSQQNSPRGGESFRGCCSEMWLPAGCDAAARWPCSCGPGCGCRGLPRTCLWYSSYCFLLPRAASH